MKRIVILAIVLAISALAVGVNAETFRVPSEYPTIQSAIDIAAAGDTVQVELGTFYENITLIPKITLLGMGPANTVIDGEFTGPVIVAADSVVIEGFRIRNGTLGIYLSEGFAVVRGNAITGCRGYGVSCQSASALIMNNAIYNNGDQAYSGGISCNSLLDIVITNNIFYDNSASCIYFSTLGSGSSIKNNVFYSSGTGYGLYNGRFAISGNGVSSPIIENCIFSNFYENSLFMQSGAAPTVQYCNFYSTAGTVPPNAGNTTGNPLFVDVDRFDFRLQPGSPCINAGNPSTLSNDTDGSRNDMGVFGGPNAADDVFTNGAPLVPREFTAIAGNGTVTLNWGPHEILGNSEDFSHYKIYRTSPQAASTTEASTEFSDINLTNGVTYSYAIAAVDTLGNESDLSRVLMVTPHESVTMSFEVNAAGGADYTRIQDAIDAAEAGDTIFVRSGRYFENLQMKSGISLIGAGPSTTVIDGGGINSTIIGAAHSLITGFTIQNGKAQRGGGILCVGNAMKIVGNRITRNRATYYGGAGMDTGQNGGPHQIHNNVIDNNWCDTSSSAWAGGISSFDASDIINNTIYNNYCPNAGGGIGIHSMGRPQPNIQNNVISNNSAVLGGGIYGYSYLQTNYNDVYNNDGGNFGGYGFDPGTGDIDVDPLLMEGSGHDFRLQPSSTCIDAGNPDALFYDHMFPPSQGTARNDIGAFGGPLAVDWGESYGNTPVGQDVVVILSGSLSVSFANVLVEGFTGAVLSDQGPALSDLYTALPEDSPQFLDFLSDATFEGQVEICITYDDANIGDSEADLLFLHYVSVDTGWVNATSTLDTALNTICCVVSSLSPFVLARPGSATSIVTTVDLTVPKKFGLSQNYPNPFNPVTVIEFGLPSAATVKLDIFNILGRRVDRLVNEQLSAGYHQVFWDASQKASGVYFYRLEAGDFVETKKMLLLK